MECESALKPFHDAWVIRRTRKAFDGQRIEIVGSASFELEMGWRGHPAKRHNQHVSQIEKEKFPFMLFLPFHSWHIDSLSSLCLNCEIRLGISYENQHMGHSFHWNWRHVDLIASSSKRSHSHTFNCTRSEWSKWNKAKLRMMYEWTAAAPGLMMFYSTSTFGNKSQRVQVEER